MPVPSPAEAVSEDSGALLVYGPPEIMERFHRHNDIEINFLERGAMTYLFAGGRRRVVAGSLAVFWATFPHRTVEVVGGPVGYFMHVPLGVFLQWRLPAPLVAAVLHGQLLVDTDPVHCAIDLAHFPLWYESINKGEGSEPLATAYLEVHARLRRLGLSAAIDATPGASLQASVAAPSASLADQVEKLEKMAAFIAERYTHDIAPTDVASHVALHPKYAMFLFRKAYDMTIGEYITQHRLSHAQRLLATTDKKIVDLALEAGFGSASQFYDVFSRACGRTPTSFRQALRTIR